MAKSEAKVKFTAETSEFNQAISKSNQQMGELRAELRLNEAQMKTSGASIEALEQKHSILSSQLETAEAKTAALSGKVEAAARIFGEDSAEVSKLRIQLLNAQAAEEKIRQAINNCNSELEQQRAASGDAEAAHETLTDTIERQQTELRQLKSRYSELVASGEETSSEAQQLAGEIRELSGDLRKNQQAAANADAAADKLDKSFRNAGDAAASSQDGFTVLKGTIADLASEAIQLAISKISEFIDYLWQLPEATRELRQDFATLETSFENANLTAEQGTQTWKDLYTIFGEDDRAVEAANLISKMSSNQQDLNDWVTITQGIWGSYQDSLPVEGLAEAAMETARTGDVTGVLADALNWSSEAAEMFADYMNEDVTNAEDAFQEALNECTTEQERQALITETLTALYGDAAAKYEEASGSQLAAKEATAELLQAEADLAAVVEPANTAWTQMKTTLLEAVTPAIQAVCNGLSTAFNWLQQHPAVMYGVIAVLGALAIGFTGVAAALGIMALQAMLANVAFLPIIAVVAAVAVGIGLLVAAIVACVQHWDQIKAAAISAWESIKSAFSAAGQWFMSTVVTPIATFFTNLWDGIKNAASTAWNFICNAVQFGIMFIGSILSAAFQIITLPFRFIWENCKDTVLSAWESIKSAVSTALNAIQTVISSAWNAIVGVISPILSSIKSSVSSAWDGIKSATSTAFNTVKTVASNVWNGIKSTVSNAANGVKTSVSNGWNSIKSATSGAFNSVKSTASGIWNGIKSTISNAINGAGDAVKNAIDKIKSFFNFSWSLPPLKLPHITITGEWGFNPPRVPSFGISWYKDGGIMMHPTIFGLNGNKLMAGGEAGPEAILPISNLEGYIENAIENKMNVVNLQALADAIEELANRPMELNINGKRFAYATAGDTDSVSGIRSTFKGRGLVLD